MPDIEVTATPRGFAVFGDEVVTDYGHKVRIQQSSSAMKDACWMFIDKEEGVPGELPACDVAVHMTVDQATAIRDRLTAWIESVPAPE
jgi:hypothetical protein